MPRVTAVDIVLDILENSHGNFHSEVLSKVVACNMEFFQIKIYPRFSEHTRVFVQHECCDEIFKLSQQWFNVRERYMQVY